MSAEVTPVAAVSISRNPDSQNPNSRNSDRSFSERLAALASRIECRRADTTEEREAIFRLRYRAYLREGAIAADPSQRFTDAADNDDNAYLLGFYIDGVLASSLRLHIGSREHRHFPSLAVFSDVLQPRVDAGKVLVDATRFVADEKLSRLHRGLPYATLRPCMLAAEYFHADDLLAAVRAEHQAFYRRAFGHRLLCAPRPYPQLVKPISLMSVDFPSAAESLYDRYPFFRSTALDRRKLFERPPAPRISLQPDSHEPEMLPGVARPFAERGALCHAT
jgi:hypothetical protein